jgi:hypothetical protein
MSFCYVELVPFCRVNMEFFYVFSYVTVCLVGEPRERSGTDPCFGDGSNPS